MGAFNHLHLPSEEIPVMGDVDTAIIGGSMAGISSALKLAGLGKQVIIVESRTYGAVRI
ncbi:FAD binding domain-containing protein [Scopulibacillus darangshiensis]|uniref:FAD binding domain-containing protein n=1 Tax=Scopulibacillus darangshiensis TaxID=442528 RepID=A0A4R2P3T9_9BACL|nr:hypothetical protein [Scopulibacillus darangshiensis]TCP29459.1 FAD binding domain-containing protein [Scopulibacillus darangshiensis]